MKLAPPLLVALVLAGSSLPIAVSARRLGAARDGYETAVASLEGTRRRADRVLQLRTSEQRVAEQKRPEQDVIARANAALRAARLRENSLGSVRTEADTTLARPAAGAGPEYRRQSVRLVLRRLTIEEIGQFLGAWSSTQELWTPAQIDLNHARGATGTPRFDMSLLVSTTYIAER